MRRLVLGVDGWPPSKSEAASLFAVEHPHADRVGALLEAAATALRNSRDWDPAETSPVALALTLRVPEGTEPPSDATNYLGGVADVLQAQRTNVDLSHLGELSEVALYANDSQLMEISFRIERDASIGYEISVSTS